MEVQRMQNPRFIMPGDLSGQKSPLNVPFNVLWSLAWWKVFPSSNTCTLFTPAILINGPMGFDGLHLWKILVWYISIYIYSSYINTPSPKIWRKSVTLTQNAGMFWQNWYGMILTWSDTGFLLSTHVHPYAIPQWLPIVILYCICNKFYRVPIKRTF